MDYILGIVRSNEGLIRVLVASKNTRFGIKDGHTTVKHKVPVNSVVIFNVEDIYVVKNPGISFGDIQSLGHFVFHEFLVSQKIDTDDYVSHNFSTVYDNAAFIAKVNQGRTIAKKEELGFTDLLDMADKMPELYEMEKKRKAELEKKKKKLSEQGWEEVDEGFWREGIFIFHEQKEFMDSALKMAKHQPTMIMIKGGSGYGKTTLPRVFAEACGMNHLRWNCAAVRDPEEWFGTREFRDGETHFITTQLTKVIEQGNAVIVFDEFNRVEPWLHNTLFPLLDDDHATIIHDYEVKCGENVLFVATINEGSKYAGTFFMDTALVNRVSMTMKVGVLPPDIEAKICLSYDLDFLLGRKLADIFVKLRNVAEKKDWEVDVSTRSFHKICRILSETSMSIVRSFDVVIGQHLSEEAQKEVVDIVRGVA